MCSTNERDGGRLVEHIEVVCPSNRSVNGCKRDEPVPVKRFAQRCDLNVFDTPPHLKSLKTWDFPVMDCFDVGVVVSFGYFLVRSWIALRSTVASLSSAVDTADAFVVSIFFL